MKTTTILKAASILALLATGAEAQIKVSLDSPPDLEGSGSYVWAHTFASYLNDHGMAAEEYQRGALGGDDEVFDQVTQGLVEVGMSPLGIVGSIDTLIYGLRLPYFFNGMGDVDRALYDHGMLERINAALTPSGVRVLAVDTVGPATGIFNTRHAVTQMSDMSDLRMRALDESQIELYRAWGSNGTIVSWAEVPNALQTGVADGYLNPAFVPLLFGHTEFIHYFTPAEISPSLRIAIASEDWYSGLSDDDRATVDAAVTAANTANRDWLGTQTGVLDQLRAAGVEISDLSPEARAEFRTASEGTWSAIVTPEQLAQWQAAIAE
ncbi:MAG: TRAP transporter substrate-binding protein DctP [Rhodobacter sp.]|nr:TRAP transporter substrate-binding protein DctP [Paracoccaceae bacterium]MCB1408202.1 TRAP transporter substrate-binding protein DctP [Paracoccaceae bacterium]MCC0081092.1 TRAP transporter substrate-binding protein DctP [Rhodobacter sp.]